MAVNIGVNIQRSPNRINQALREAGVNGQYPKLLFNFEDNYYLTNGSSKSLNDAFTFTRNGNATMVDSDGLIKWAPHNLLSYSESASDQSFNGASYQNDVIISPDGNNNGDKIYELASTSNHYMGTYTFLTEANVAYTTMVFAKAGERTILQSSLSSASGLGSNGYANFNLESGTITATGSGVTASISSVGNGWYLCKTTAVYTTGTAAQQAWMIQTSPTAIRGANYTGDGSSGIYLWGWSAYRSDLGGMVNNPVRGDSYVPTTSSAVYMPRVGHHKYNGDQWVDKGGLFESEARTNLVSYSGAFGQWQKNNVFITTNTAISVDGNQLADTFEVFSTASNPNIYINYSSYSSNNYTFSVYVKYLSSQWFALGSIANLNNVAFFDLLNGVVGTVATGYNASIERCGNGWFRCSVTFSGSTAGPYPSIYAPDSDGSLYSTVGNSVYIYGAQLEEGSTPSSYIPTNGSSVTRAAESITVPYANLPWPTPTYIGDELVTNGTFDTDSDWSKTGEAYISGGVGVVYTSDGVLAKLVQSGLPLNTPLELTYTIVASNAGFLNLGFGTGYQVIPSTVGSHTVIMTTTTGLLELNRGSGITDISVDNVSVREINPLSVSIAVKGEMDYADEDAANTVVFHRRYLDVNNFITTGVFTDGTRIGLVAFEQRGLGVYDATSSSPDAYIPDLNVPFNIASRHGSTFINGATDGVALTANTTPTALPDLSTTDLSLAYDFMGTISSFRIWDKDIGDTGIAEATKPSTEPSLSLTFDGQPSSFTNTGLTL